MRKAKMITTREYMMKFIYQIDMNKEDLTDLNDKLENFLNDNFEYIKNRYEELKLQFSDEADVELEETELSQFIDLKYSKELVESFNANKESIDSLINKYAKNWTINRMAKVDLAILRLAICEILYMSEMPTKVSINEAIELAKLYCDDKSPKFINGILGSVVSEIGEK
ncbi:MAG: transcription antitermination factor NusB [Paraclostridium bifermentans]|uniref:Transcription antitermination protein NusB n=1 Tax=Paraclostridium bifermentans TaxID=1490 RepID=A0AA44DI06_PARBF|nr:MULTISPECIES: transcription antitermination factor NusB [Paraclostridium]MBN8048376.1 transcription antitermination factor NusB [Paraclostridium bifermentans]MBS6507760.1 transcription antitermination factor NusB [Paraclostridium bifermentans]MBZ6005941.1 transcription antitermination factor NusB [Paraclostridium bifermentans]MCU9810440.1 transcription antitermination factor NusB [Paraclostridium sp. AKS81]MDU0296076.1 transcription antitermination factor NusB [Paraclostridium sp. MRS3W1]